MTTTPYLKLQKPPFDSIPWDAALNGNMDILDGYISRYMSTPNFVGAWTNSTAYVVGQTVLDTSNSFMYNALVTHTSAASPTTFAQDRVANPTYWQQLVIGSPGAGFAPLASPVFTGDPTAPTASPGDNDTSIATTAFVHGEVATAQAALTPSFNNVGRNHIRNPQFRIAQRGGGPFTTFGSYGLDQWLCAGTLDNVSITQTSISDAGRLQIGDESAIVSATNVFTGNAGAAAFSALTQRIENCRLLAGKTVTLSFWAVAASGTPKLGINGQTNYGTGGSPSSAVTWLATGQTVTLSTTWTRYSVTMSIPNNQGKTFGSAGDNYHVINIYYSSGATGNQVAGNIGVQSGTISVWGVQLEVGSVATQLEQLPFAFEIARCSRYLQIATVFATGYNVAGQPIYGQYFWPVQFRASPNIVYSGQSYVNASALATYQSTAVGYVAQGTVTATGTAIAAGTATASAEL